MTDGYIAIPCAVPVMIPRRLLNEYAAAIRAHQTGNFVIHVHDGKPLGFTFEQKHRLSEEERSDEIVLG